MRPIDADKITSDSEFVKATVMSRGYDRDYDQRKDQWAKYWEEKEKGAGIEDETK